jgi:hypothetical protein
MSAGPIDPRLLRYASASRWFLLAGGVVGFLQTVTVVAAAWFATALIVGITPASSWRGRCSSGCSTCSPYGVLPG